MSGPYRDAAAGPTPLDEAIGNAVTAFLTGIVKVAQDNAARAKYEPPSLFVVLDQLAETLAAELSIVAGRPVRLYMERSPVCREMTCTVRSAGKTLASVTINEQQMVCSDEQAGVMLYGALWNAVNEAVAKEQANGA